MLRYANPVPAGHDSVSPACGDRDLARRGEPHRAGPSRRRETDATATGHRPTAGRPALAPLREPAYLVGLVTVLASLWMYAQGNAADAVNRWPSDPQATAILAAVRAEETAALPPRTSVADARSSSFDGRCGW